MSAKLRSLIDYLKAPLRLWRRGRQLPARMQIAALVAGAVFVLAGVTVWTVARVRAQDEGGGGTTQSVYDQVHRLRTEKNYDAAQTVATDFLAAHLERDNERQMVYFEYGLTLFDAQKWPEAGAAFGALVAEYADTALDPTAPAFVVDNAAYYAAVTQHYHGDKARGITLYEAFLKSFPESNRRPKALLMLAGAHEQTGDLPGAIPVFEQLVQEFPESEWAPEAQIHVGHIRLGNKNYAGAAAAFNEVVQRWPESKHVPTALQFGSRALIHQELTDWEPHDGVVRPGTVDNSAALEAVAAQVESQYGDSPICVGVLDDMYNYYAKRAWWNRGAREGLNAKLRQLAEKIEARDPEGEHGTRAILRIADTLRDTDPAQALQLIESAQQAASERGQDSIWFDARFAKARLLNNAFAQPVAARTLFEELLTQDLPRIVPEGEGRVCLRGEVEIQIGSTYLREQAYDQALGVFQRLIEDDQLLDSARATASFYAAFSLHQLGRRHEALAVLDAAAARYPQTAVVTVGVRPLRATLMQLP